MAFAVTLLLNAFLADAVAACWRRLAEADLSRSMLDLRYPPHVTLAIFDQLDLDATSAALAPIMTATGPLQLALNGITSFGAGSGVCYVALAPSSELLQLHAQVLNAIGRACRDHYQIGRWTPHCTLAVDLADPEIKRAQDVLANRCWPLIGEFESAELVEFAPVFVIKRWTTPVSSRTP